MWGKEKKKGKHEGPAQRRHLNTSKDVCKEVHCALSFIPFSRVYAQDVTAWWWVSVTTAHLRGPLDIPVPQRYEIWEGISGWMRSPLPVLLWAQTAFLVKDKCFRHCPVTPVLPSGAHRERLSVSVTKLLRVPSTERVKGISVFTRTLKKITIYHDRFLGSV